MCPDTVKDYYILQDFLDFVVIAKFNSALLDHEIVRWTMNKQDCSIKDEVLPFFWNYRYYSFEVQKLFPRFFRPYYGAITFDPHHNAMNRIWNQWGEINLLSSCICIKLIEGKANTHCPAFIALFFFFYCMFVCDDTIFFGINRILLV